jgi:manganese transport protein
LFLINKGIRKWKLYHCIGCYHWFFLYSKWYLLNQNWIKFCLINSFDANEAAIVIGITVMPHLYLHSLWYKPENWKNYGWNQAGFEIQFHRFYHFKLRLLVNAAILILAAATFYRNGMFEVAEIQDAHRFLEPPEEVQFAFICCCRTKFYNYGNSCRQIVMEGYLNLRIQPWVRRIITRLIHCSSGYCNYYLWRKCYKLWFWVRLSWVCNWVFIIPLIHFAWLQNERTYCTLLLS